MKKRLIALLLCLVMVSSSAFFTISAEPEEMIDTVPEIETEMLETETQGIVLQAADIHPPTPPQKLRVTSMTTGTIRIAWEHSLDNYGVSEYLVYNHGELIETTTNAEFVFNNIEKNAVMMIAVYAKDFAGNMSESSNLLGIYHVEGMMIATQIDVPTDFRVNNVFKDEITLTWNGSDSLYEVYCDNELLGTTTEKSYKVTGLNEEKAYMFKIRAKDLNGEYSNFSNLLCVYHINNDIVSVDLTPIELVVESVQTDGITLKWTTQGNSENIQRYEIYDEDRKVGETAANTYTVTGLENGNTYMFTVKAISKDGRTSPQSNFVCVYHALGDSTALSAPVLLPVKEIEIGETTAKLSWYRAQGGDGNITYSIFANGKIIAGGISENECEATDLDSGTEYTVKIIAKDGSGNTSESNPIKFKTKPAIKPTTRALVRTMGMEFDQRYDINPNVVKPEILKVSVREIDKAKGEFALSIYPEQYKCDLDAEPFFFWSAREGTFEEIKPDYTSVLFRIDPESIGRDIRVVVGMGDGLGCIDKKIVVLDKNLVVEPTLSIQSQEQQGFEIMSSAMLEESINMESQGKFDLAMAIDTSEKMSEFDASGNKTWIKDIESLVETSVENTNFSVINQGIETLQINSKEVAIETLEEISQKDYANKSNDALTLLEQCESKLAQNPSNPNKIAFVVSTQVENASKLQTKIETMQAQGTAVYVMAMVKSEEEAQNIANIDGLYVSRSELEFRLNISDLYYAFANIEESTQGTQMMATQGTSTLENISDFKPEKHMFSTVNSSLYFGASLASLLGIYGCVPAVAEKGNISYDLISSAGNHPNFDKLITGNLEGMALANDNNIFKLYDTMKNDFTSDLNYVVSGNTTSIKTIEIIKKNLKRRFPLLMIDTNNTVRIIVGYDDIGGLKLATCRYGSSEMEIITSTANSKIIDTYAYLIEISKQQNIIDKDKGGIEESFYEEILFAWPKVSTDENAEDIPKNDIKIYKYGKTIQESFTKHNLDSKNWVRISNPEAESIILVGIKNSFNGAIPNIYNSNRKYIVKKYNDLLKAEQRWYMIVGLSNICYTVS